MSYREFKSSVMVAFLCAIVFSANSLEAQTLPKLKKADEISTGTFSNGIDYFFVNNTPVAGRADFALVQIGDFSVPESRDSFAELEHMDADSFLSEQGVHYTEDGFISYFDGARVFHFPDVNIKNKAIADSTLLLVLDLMQLYSGPQIVIVCGDIDKSQWEARFGTIGLVIPKVFERSYESTIPKEGFVFRNDESKGLVSFVFQPGSVSSEQAGTAIPLMSEYLFFQFRHILKDRLTLAFKEEGIPFFFIDDKDNIDIYFDAEDDVKAKSIISDAMADLANGGATLEELIYAKNLALPDIVSTGLRIGKPNSFYIDRCIQSIINGSNLASEETIRNFFSRRKISPKRELELFNNFAKALLGDNYCASDEFKFKRQSYPDISAALKVNSKGAKVVNTITEPLTGGKFWLFNNGIRVIYKYLPSEEGVSYCLAQRGGASSMSNLAHGESRFLSDMFLLNRDSGIEGDEFDKMLRTRGIKMYERVTLEDTVLGGTAPAEEFETVLKALLKMAYDRQEDKKAFDYYRECQRLRSSVELPEIYSVMDSLMCPGYDYLDNSSAFDIEEGLLSRANYFFDERFSNMTDGVFIIIGNISESVALQVLGKYLGSFRTSGPYALREKVPYDFYSGHTTFIEEGDDSSVNLAAMGLLPVNMDNFLMFQMAMEAIKRQLAKSLYSIGMYAEVSGRMRTAPVESFSFYITLRACSQDGLPAGIDIQEHPIDAFKIAREEIIRMQYMSISQEEFESYKNIVKKRMESSLASSDGMMNYVFLRYLSGRDLASDYQRKLDGIVVDDLRWILEEIISSGIVEYIVK